MALLESLYAAGMSAVRRIAPVAGVGSARVARGVRGREASLEALEGWAATERDPDRPLIWIHAPSVGEGLQSKAVVEACRARAPDAVQWIFTHFSPSAEPLAARMPVGWAGYLPWDVERPVSRALAAARPSALVFTKTEVWPVLSRAAAARGVPTALVAATLPANSSRAGVVARRLLHPSMARLARVAAIADDDAVRFRGLGVRADALSVTGDPGIDSAAARAAASDPEASWLRPFHRHRRPTVVAGSTWPADEAVLVPALTRLRAGTPDLRLIVAPHEPDDTHLPPLRSALREAGWSTALLAEVEADPDRAAEVGAVVVDRVGVLASLYTVADAAFVGGGFHDKGLHSVLEPAAAGVPVAFGPGHHNARAASELLAERGAAVAADAERLAEVLGAWLADPGAGRRAGELARFWIDRHRGAADRTASLLLDLVLSETPA